MAWEMIAAHLENMWRFIITVHQSTERLMACRMYIHTDEIQQNRLLPITAILKSRIWTMWGDLLHSWEPTACAATEPCWMKRLVPHLKRNYPSPACGALICTCREKR